MLLNRIRTVTELRSELDAHRTNGSTIGFVPTMGFLHEGHGSLLRRAREESDVVVLSIFVNPLQFNDETDYEVYPNDDALDDRIAAKYGVDIVFNPSVAEMYPDGTPKTSVRVSDVTEVLEGKYRPGHFDGVTLVVNKLLHMVEPTRAYFGEKDYQQLAVVRQMVADLSMRSEIVGCPIVRDEDGLALSSRNSLLSADQRRRALSLSNALQVGQHQFLAGVTDPVMLVSAVREVLESESDVKVDYVAAVDCDTLRPPNVLSVPFQLLVAATVDNVRLIDNCRVEG